MHKVSRQTIFAQKRKTSYTFFCITLFFLKQSYFEIAVQTRANCYIFSGSSGMEGSENVKSNLPFSQESEQDLYDRFSSKNRSS